MVFDPKANAELERDLVNLNGIAKASLKKLECEEKRKAIQGFDPSRDLNDIEMAMCQFNASIRNKCNERNKFAKELLQ